MAISRISCASNYDVCICGAGLAGLCLARQLKLEMPELKILLVDRDVRPLSSGTHKVGESSIEVGSHYFGHTLGLEDYLDRIHKHKCALRFYTKDGSTPIDQRTEFGTLDFPLIPAVQIDRGVFENDLRQMCIDAGIDLLEGVMVEDVRFGRDGESHEIDLRGRDREVRAVRATWVVDAMGRRRFLAKKLGLTREVGHKGSACWWRIPGQWELTDSVEGAAKAADSDWRKREIGKRWYATNHFMGHGYWVWFIPVASHTSVGIVSDESIHPIAERSSIDKALAWLERNEPHVARWIKDAPADDFLALKNFAHASSQCYSIDRWALSGEAAMFGDPYYSTGSDLIALQNNVITRMIRRDRRGELSEMHVRHYNDLVAEVFRGILALYENQYPVFGSDYLQNTKTMWDFDFLLGAVGKLGFGPHVLDEVEHLPALTMMLKRWSDLNLVVQKLLRDWVKLVPGKMLDRSPGSLVGPRGLITPTPPVFQNFNDQLRMRDATKLIEDCTGEALRYVEGRAVWMFKKAVRDLRPMADAATRALIDRVEAADWLNPNAIDLDPSTWERNGLFGTTEVRMMDAMQMEYFAPSPPEREDAILMQNTPHEAVWKKIASNPDALAVVSGDRRLTYRELGQMVASVHHHVSHTYDRRRGTAAVVGEPSVEMLAVWLGTLSAGLGFAAIPPGANERWYLRDVGADFVVSSDPMRNARTATYRDLIDDQPRMNPSLAAPTLGNRLQPCQSRYIEEGNTLLVRTISCYSFTNLCIYQELALREHMALNMGEDTYRKPVLLSTTNAGQDWLLPLMYGGTLIIPPPMTPDGALFDIVKRVAADVGGQPIIGGVPDTLMRVGRGLMHREDVTLLAIDKVLKSSESAALSKITTAVVNGGVVAWGYEHLWADDFKQKLAMEGRML